MITLNGHHIFFQCFLNPKYCNVDSRWNVIGQHIEVNCIPYFEIASGEHIHVHHSIQITRRLVSNHYYESIYKNCGWLTLGIWAETNLQEGCDSTIPTWIFNICEMHNLCKVTIWICYMEWGFLFLLDRENMHLFMWVGNRVP